MKTSSFQQTHGMLVLCQARCGLEMKETWSLLLSGYSGASMGHSPVNKWGQMSCCDIVTGFFGCY